MCIRDRDQTAFSLLIERQELQALNHWILAINNIVSRPTIRPSELYETLYGFDADLLSVRGQLIDEVSVYSEANRQALFDDLFKRLMSRLSLETEKLVRRIDWDDALFEKRRLLRINLTETPIAKHSRVFLAVRSDMPGSEISHTFALAAKLADVSKIVELVRHGLPGIAMSFLPIPPSELKSQVDTTYFSIDHNDRDWNDVIEGKGQITLHIDDRIRLKSVSLYVLE